MSNYPPGSDIKDAPWNIPDVKPFNGIRFDVCSKCGDEEDESIQVNEDDICERCYYDEN